VYTTTLGTTTRFGLYMLAIFRLYLNLWGSYTTYGGYFEVWGGGGGTRSLCVIGGRHGLGLSWVNCTSLMRVHRVFDVDKHMDDS
jgi:hypothetical protein